MTDKIPDDPGQDRAFEPAVDTEELLAVQAEMNPGTPAEVINRLRSGLVGLAVTDAQVGQVPGHEDYAGPMIQRMDVDRTLEVAGDDRLSRSQAREMVGEIQQLVDRTPEDAHLQRTLLRLKQRIYGHADVGPVRQVDYIQPSRAPTPVRPGSAIPEPDASLGQERMPRAYEWKGTPITVGPRRRNVGGKPNAEGNVVGGEPTDDGINVILMYGDDGWYISEPNGGVMHLPAWEPGEDHAVEFGRERLGGHKHISRKHFTLETGMQDDPDTPPPVWVNDFSTYGTVVTTYNYPLPPEDKPEYQPRHRREES